jgi:acyl-CoA reductase-like NAD-dependent aldehyde dehydrogenase
VAGATAPEQIDPQTPYPLLKREPYGVAALIIPFNWPLAVMMTKLTSALTAGNTAVAKLRRNSTNCTACRLWQYGFHQHHVVCGPQRQVVVQLFTCRPGMQERPVDAAGELH